MTDPTAGDTGPPGPPTTGRRLGRWLRRGGWRAMAGAAVGAVALATYSHFVGCRTGTCFLTADVPTATVVGGLVGLVTGWPAPSNPTS
jgi:anti-sigma-K factor RskA